VSPSFVVLRSSELLRTTGIVKTEGFISKRRLLLFPTSLRKTCW